MNKITETQAWDGLVLDVFPEYFVAKVTDASVAAYPTSVTMEIGMDEIPLGSRHLVVTGAEFTWCVVSTSTPDGTELDVQISFAAPPVWTDSDISEATEAAKRIMILLDIKEADGQ